MIGAYGDANRRQDQNAGGGGDANNDAVPRGDHTRSQKADPHDDLADAAQVQGRLLIDTTESREGINANANQDTRADNDKRQTRDFQTKTTFSHFWQWYQTSSDPPEVGS